MKGEVKAYGIDLRTDINSERIMTDELKSMVTSMDGFIGIAPYGGGRQCNFYNSPTVAVLFDSASNRNKAYRKLSETMEVAVILETAHVPAMWLREEKAR